MVKSVEAELKCELRQARQQLVEQHDQYLEWKLKAVLVDTLTQQLQDEKEKVATKDAQLATKDARVVELEAELAKLKDVQQDNSTLRRQLQDQKEHGASASAQIVTKDARVVELEAELAKLRDVQQQNSTLQQQLQTEKEQVATASAHITTKDARVVELEAELAELRLAVQRAVGGATEAQLQYEAELTELRTKLQGSFKTTRHAEARCVELEDELHSLRAKLHAIPQDGNNSDASRRQLEEQVTKLTAELQVKNSDVQRATQAAASAQGFVAELMQQQRSPVPENVTNCFGCEALKQIIAELRERLGQSNLRSQLGPLGQWSSAGSLLPLREQPRGDYQELNRRLDAKVLKI